ncbi:MAG: hypothetical protein ABIH72_04550 [archaeon]
MAEKYSSKIELEFPVLEITLEYQRKILQEDVDVALDCLQHKLSKCTNPLPIGRIVEKPELGEMQTEIANFRVSQGKPVYNCLRFVHCRAPHVLPRLVQDLEAYIAKNNISLQEKELIEYATSGLQEILASKN